MLSCSKENTDINKNPENKIATFEEYMKFLNTETKNSLLIQSASVLGSSNNLFTMSARSLQSNSALSFKLDGTEYKPNDYTTIGNNTSWVRSDLDLTSLYGKKISLSYTNNQIHARMGSAIGNEVTIYIPELISANVSNLQDGKVIPGTIITWNIDTANANGMVLGVEYNPSNQTEQSIAESFNTKITRGSTVQDNGSYTITANDLSYFPDNSKLSFYIGRASFVITNDGNPNNDISIGAYTIVRSDFKIDK